MSKASAPGKIILFGEHAVVYARPAIAVPVFQVRAEVEIERLDASDLEIDLVNLSRRYNFADALPDDPIAAIIRATCARLQVEPRGVRVRVRSTIPIGGGLGSGAAVSVAMARALAQYFLLDADERGGTRTMMTLLSNVEISALAYEVEKLHHGTPSGIDNTVIAFEQPVYFVRDQPIESFRVARPFTIAIADTGIAAPTKIAVGDVRRAWEQNRAHYEMLFDQVALAVRRARVAIEQGNLKALGMLMNANQTILEMIGVSSPEIETLIDAALRAGACGAKLSGAGRGGNVIALVDEVTQDKVARAMGEVGAKRVIVTRVE